MPKGKGKKPYGSNKKKKKSSARTSSQHSSDSRNENESDNNNNPTPDQGMYQTYKVKTQSFRDRIQKLLPTSIKLKSVSDLSRASDVIFEKVAASVSISVDVDVNESQSQNNHNLSEKTIKNDHNALESMSFVIPHEIILDLDESIKLRSEVGKKFGADVDDGHAYMLSTLEYCRKKLKQARSILKIKRKSTKPSISTDITNSQQNQNDELKSICNRFDHLADSDSDSDRDSDDGNKDEGNDDIDIVITEDMVKKGSYPIVSPPKQPREAYSIEDLIKGSDRFQACSFISSIEHHMLVIGFQLKALKKITGCVSDYARSLELQDNENQDPEPLQRQREKFRNANLQALLKYAAVTNMAIESVQSMEAALMVDRPHLSTFYIVIAVVFFDTYIDEIETMMKQKEHQNGHLVKKFVGEVIELVFHAGGDAPLEGIVKRFVQEAKLEYKYKFIHEKAVLIKDTMLYETGSAMEESLNPDFFQSFGKMSKLKPHSGIQGCSYIGEDRSILNTQKLVQKRFDGLAFSGNHLVAVQIFYGDVWIEDEVPAKKIRGDLDQLLSADILPELINWCISSYAYMKIVPDSKELLTLMHLVSTHVDKVFDKKKKNLRIPVPISLTFGLHILLTSIFELQGNGEVTRLAKFAKTSFNTLFEQLEDVLNSEYAKQLPSFEKQVSTLKGFKNFVQPSASGRPVSDTSEEHAFWNPVIGGQLLLFAVYATNIGLGSVSMDQIGQLRFTLHLYNAFKQNKLMGDDDDNDDEGQLQLLNMLDKALYDKKSIWFGSRPVKGEFWKRFHLSLIRSTQDKFPGEISASYKRVVKRDFSEDIDDYNSRNGNFGKERKKVDETVNDFMSRSEMTMGSMKEDEMDIKPINFFKVAVILYEFVYSFCDMMGWNDAMKRLMTSDYTSATKVTVVKTNLPFIKQFLNHLDSLNIESNQNQCDSVIPFCDHSKAARFMSQFFKSIPEDSYRYFCDEIKDMNCQNQDKYRASKIITNDDFATADELLRRGQIAFNNGNLGEALISYKCALHEIEPKSGIPGFQTKNLVTICSNLAFISFRLCSFPDAEEYATKALKVDPQHNRSLYIRAAACYEISMNSQFGDVERLKRAIVDLTKCELDLKQKAELETKIITAIRGSSCFSTR